VTRHASLNPALFFQCREKVNDYDALLARYYSAEESLNKKDREMRELQDVSRKDQRSIEVDRKKFEEDVAFFKAQVSDRMVTCTLKQWFSNGGTRALRGARMCSKGYTNCFKCLRDLNLKVQSIITGAFLITVPNV